MWHACLMAGKYAPDSPGGHIRGHKRGKAGADADRKSDRTGQPANCGSLALTERSSEHEKKGSGNIKSSLDDW